MRLSYGSKAITSTFYEKGGIFFCQFGVGYQSSVAVGCFSSV